MNQLGVSGSTLEGEDTRQVPIFIEETALRTFEQAERQALLIAMRFLAQNSRLTQNALGKILGVERHVIKRRLEKHNLQLDSPEVMRHGKIRSL